MLENKQRISGSVMRFGTTPENFKLHIHLPPTLSRQSPDVYWNLPSSTSPSISSPRVRSLVTIDLAEKYPDTPLSRDPGRDHSAMQTPLGREKSVLIAATSRLFFQSFVATL